MIDIENVAALARVFGDRLLKIFQGDLKDAWEQLPAEEKKVAQAVAIDAAEVYASSLAGKDVERDLRAIAAQRANLASAGAEVGRRAFVKMIQDLALEAGKAALAIGAMVA